MHRSAQGERFGVWCSRKRLAALKTFVPSCFTLVFEVNRCLRSQDFQLFGTLSSGQAPVPATECIDLNSKRPLRLWSDADHEGLAVLAFSWSSKAISCGPQVLCAAVCLSWSPPGAACFWRPFGARISRR